MRDVHAYNAVVISHPAVFGCSYYVNNSHPDYEDTNMEEDDADMNADEAEEGGDGSGQEGARPATGKSVPKITDYSTIRRSILAEKPRVTRFPIDWA